MQCKTCQNQNAALVRRLKRAHPKSEAGGRCYACGEEADELMLDHDHAANAFRGRACRGCNNRLALPYARP